MICCIKYIVNDKYVKMNIFVSCNHIFYIHFITKIIFYNKTKTVSAPTTETVLLPYVIIFIFIFWNTYFKGFKPIISCKKSFAFFCYVRCIYNNIFFHGYTSLLTTNRSVSLLHQLNKSVILYLL